MKEIGFFFFLSVKFSKSSSPSVQATICWNARFQTVSLTANLLGAVLCCLWLIHRSWPMHTVTTATLVNNIKKITLSYFQVYKTRHFQTVGPFCPEVTLVCSSLTSPGGSFSMRQEPTCSFPAMLCTWIFPLLSVVRQKSHLYKAERSLRACIGGSFLAFLNWKMF